MKGVGEAAYALRLLERLGAEYAEAYVEDFFSKSFALERGRPSANDFTEEAGIRVRFAKDKRLYTFATNRIDKAEIERLASRFKSFKGIDTEFAPAPAVHAECDVKERKSIDGADMLSDLMRIDKDLSKIKCIKFRNVYGGLGRAHTYYINSDGTEIKGSTPYVSSIYVLTIKNGAETRETVVQEGAVAGYECFDAARTSERLADDVESIRRVMEKGVTLSDSEMKKVRNVVIGPEVTGIAVHESVGHPNEADRVFGREAAQAGMSYITRNNLGLEIGSDRVNIVDDPTIKGSNGYFAYDDEGVKARAKTLVEKGRQKELLTNREYASVFGGRSNGSARSDSYMNEPLIRMSNTYLKPGRAEVDELIEEAGDGVYIKRFDGTEWNIDDTRSFARYKGNEAYMIKDGSIGRPVKNYRIEAYTMDFWHAVDMVANDFELFIGNCGKGEPMQGIPVTMGGASALLRFG